MFQRRIHDLIEGQSDVEVIADNFAVVGLGESMEDVIQDHDQNLKRFLQCCEEKHVQLNSEKILQRKTEVEDSAAQDRSRTVEQDRSAFHRTSGF